LEGLILKRLTIEHLHQINVLYRKCFSDTIDDAFFNWKYFSTFKDETIVIGMFDEEGLIASGALLFEIIPKKGVFLKTLRCTDLMTHPDHRGKGASKKIAQALNEYISDTKLDVVYTMCSKVATKSFVKTGWKFQKEIHYYFKPRIFSLVSLYIRSKEVKYSLESISSEFICDLYKVNHSDNEFLKFIEWRYSNPKYKYEVIASKNREEFIIYTIHNSLLFIVDFEVKGSSSLISLNKVISKYNYRGIILLSTSSNLKGIKFSWCNGYTVNKINFGPLKSLLDHNAFKTAQKNETIYSYNYDDI